LRVLAINRPTHAADAERSAELSDHLGEWCKRYRSNFEICCRFREVQGGFAIMNVSDDGELAAMVAEWPLEPFNAFESYPLSDSDIATGGWTDVFHEVLGIVAPVPPGKATSRKRASRRSR
jgi:hypothetical protein